MQQFDGEKSRWMFGGCLAVFALPFFIGGTKILDSGFHLHRGDPAIPVVLGTGIVFTAISAGFIALILMGSRQSQATAQRRHANPMQPWLWRDDWAARRVREQSAGQRAALPVFALIWCAVTFPTAVIVARRSPTTPQTTIPFLFAAVGVLLLGRAAYSMLQRRKFGRSVCEIERLPIEPGQTFSGTIVRRGAEVPDGGYGLVLSCIDRVLIHRANRQSPQFADEVLWESEQRVSGALAAPSPEGTRVPFSFDIPADAPSSQARGPNERVFWQLAVSAELPGIDYNATFELPVFTTAGNAAAHQAARQEAAARRELSPASRAAVTPLPSGGIELRVGPHRDADAFMTFLLFAAIWFGTIALMWHLGAPIFFAVVFALFGLLILCMAVDFFAGTSTVDADGAGLRARHAVLGMSRAKSIEAAEVESIASKVAGHVGNRPYFDVEARLKDRSARTLARYFVSRDDADAVAAKLWEALGR